MRTNINIKSESPRFREGGAPPMVIADSGFFIGDCQMGNNQKLYWVWATMIQRCHNRNNSAYRNYGGRGIIVCDQWRNNSKSFMKWALNSGYKAGLTIERKDNDMGYNPGNCIFVDRLINNSNKRPYKCNKTGYSGISIRKTGNFRSRIRFKGILYNIGTYASINEAILNRNNFITNNNLPHKLQSMPCQ